MHAVQISAMAYSTEHSAPSSVLHQLSSGCDWWRFESISKVQNMNLPNTTPLPGADARWNKLQLQPAASVQTLHISAGQTLWIEGRAGRIWLTCEGQLQDHFLEVGQGLQFNGPARIYLSAEGTLPAQLRWTDMRDATRALVQARSQPIGLLEQAI